MVGIGGGSGVAVQRRARLRMVCSPLRTGTLQTNWVGIGGGSGVAVQRRARLRMVCSPLRTGTLQTNWPTGDAVLAEDAKTYAEIIMEVVHEIGERLGTTEPAERRPISMVLHSDRRPQPLDREAFDSQPVPEGRNIRTPGSPGFVRPWPSYTGRFT